MTTLNTQYKRLLLSGAVLLSLTACVPTTPQWDAQFGQSVRLSQQQQIIDPTAGGDAPVNGIDGASGREAIVLSVHDWRFALILDRNKERSACSN
jgi:hypothetical protein